MEKSRDCRRAPVPVLYRRLPDAHREPESFEPRRAAPGPGRIERGLDLLPHLPEPQPAPFLDGGLLERLRAVGPRVVQSSAVGRGNGFAGYQGLRCACRSARRSVAPRRGLLPSPPQRVGTNRLRALLFLRGRRDSPSSRARGQHAPGIPRRARRSEPCIALLSFCFVPPSTASSLERFFLMARTGTG